MIKDDDDDEVYEAGNQTRYPVMPSLVAMQQMKNRLHMAYLGKKLMKWTAVATGKELRRLAYEMNIQFKDYGDLVVAAFMALARARYFCAEMNVLVLEHVGNSAAVRVQTEKRSITGVKIMELGIVDNGVDPYAHLGIGRGGIAIREAKRIWKELLRMMILMVQDKNIFICLDTANKNATKKQNVLSKVVIPKIVNAITYIWSELEEQEREESFRLKRFKQKKAIYCIKSVKVKEAEEVPVEVKKTEKIPVKIKKIEEIPVEVKPIVEIPVEEPPVEGPPVEEPPQVYVKKMVEACPCCETIRELDQDLGEFVCPICKLADEAAIKGQKIEVKMVPCQTCLPEVTENKQHLEHLMAHVNQIVRVARQYNDNLVAAKNNTHIFAYSTITEERELIPYCIRCTCSDAQLKGNICPDVKDVKCYVYEHMVDVSCSCSITDIAKICMLDLQQQTKLTQTEVCPCDVTKPEEPDKYTCNDAKVRQIEKCTCGYTKPVEPEEWPYDYTKPDESEICVCDDIETAEPEESPCDDLKLKQSGECTCEPPKPVEQEKCTCGSLGQTKPGFRATTSDYSHPYTYSAAAAAHFKGLPRPHGPPVVSSLHYPLSANEMATKIEKASEPYFSKRKSGSKKCYSICQGDVCDRKASDESSREYSYDASDGINTPVSNNSPFFQDSNTYYATSSKNTPFKSRTLKGESEQGVNKCFNNKKDQLCRMYMQMQVPDSSEPHFSHSDSFYCPNCLSKMFADTTISRQKHLNSTCSHSGHKLNANTAYIEAILERMFSHVEAVVSLSNPYSGEGKPGLCSIIKMKQEEPVDNVAPTSIKVGSTSNVAHTREGYPRPRALDETIVSPNPTQTALSLYTNYSRAKSCGCDVPTELISCAKKVKIRPRCLISISDSDSEPIQSYYSASVQEEQSGICDNRLETTDSTNCSCYPLCLEREVTKITKASVCYLKPLRQHGIESEKPNTNAHCYMVSMKYTNDGQSESSNTNSTRHLITNDSQKSILPYSHDGTPGPCGILEITNLSNLIKRELLPCIQKVNFGPCGIFGSIITAQPVTTEFNKEGKLGPCGAIGSTDKIQQQARQDKIQLPCGYCGSCHTGPPVTKQTSYIREGKSRLCGVSGSTDTVKQDKIQSRCDICRATQKDITQSTLYTREAKQEQSSVISSTDKTRQNETQLSCDICRSTIRARQVTKQVTPNTREGKTGPCGISVSTSLPRATICGSTNRNEPVTIQNTPITRCPGPCGVTGSSDMAQQRQPLSYDNRGSANRFFPASKQSPRYTREGFPRMCAICTSDDTEKQDEIILPYSNCRSAQTNLPVTTQAPYTREGKSGPGGGFESTDRDKQNKRQPSCGICGSSNKAPPATKQSTRYTKDDISRMCTTCASNDTVEQDKIPCGSAPAKQPDTTRVRPDTSEGKPRPCGVLGSTDTARRDKIQLPCGYCGSYHTAQPGPFGISSSTDTTKQDKKHSLCNNCGASQKDKMQSTPYTREGKPGSCGVSGSTDTVKQDKIKTRCGICGATKKDLTQLTSYTREVKAGPSGAIKPMPCTREEKAGPCGVLGTTDTVKQDKLELTCDICESTGKARQYKTQLQCKMCGSTPRVQQDKKQVNHNTQDEKAGPCGIFGSSHTAQRVITKLPPPTRDVKAGRCDILGTSPATNKNVTQPTPYIREGNLTDKAYGSVTECKLHKGQATSGPFAGKAANSQCPSCSSKVSKKSNSSKKLIDTGYLENIYKEITKVSRYKNPDGIIIDEKQIITIKIEKKMHEKPSDNVVSRNVGTCINRFQEYDIIPQHKIHRKRSFECRPSNRDTKSDIVTGNNDLRASPKLKRSLSAQQCGKSCNLNMLSGSWAAEPELEIALKKADCGNNLGDTNSGLKLKSAGKSISTKKDSSSKYGGPVIDNSPTCSCSKLVSIVTSSLECAKRSKDADNGLKCNHTDASPSNPDCNYPKESSSKSAEPVRAKRLEDNDSNSKCNSSNLSPDIDTKREPKCSCSKGSLSKTAPVCEHRLEDTNSGGKCNCKDSSYGVNTLECSWAKESSLNNAEPVCAKRLKDSGNGANYDCTNLSFGDNTKKEPECSCPKESHFNTTEAICGNRLVTDSRAKWNCADTSRAIDTKRNTECSCSEESFFNTIKPICDCADTLYGDNTKKELEYSCPKKSTLDTAKSVCAYGVKFSECGAKYDCKNLSSGDNTKKEPECSCPRESPSDTNEPVCGNKFKKSDNGAEYDCPDSSRGFDINRDPESSCSEGTFSKTAESVCANRLEDTQCSKCNCVESQNTQTNKKRDIPLKDKYNCEKCVCPEGSLCVTHPVCADSQKSGKGAIGEFGMPTVSLCSAGTKDYDSKISNADSGQKCDCSNEHKLIKSIRLYISDRTWSNCQPRLEIKKLISSNPSAAAKNLLTRTKSCCDGGNFSLKPASVKSIESCSFNNSSFQDSVEQSCFEYRVKSCEDVANSCNSATDCLKKTNTEEMILFHTICSSTTDLSPKECSKHSKNKESKPHYIAKIFRKAPKTRCCQKRDDDVVYYRGSFMDTLRKLLLQGQVTRSSKHDDENALLSASHQVDNYPQMCSTCKATQILTDDDSTYGRYHTNLVSDTSSSRSIGVEFGTSSQSQGCSYSIKDISYLGSKPIRIITNPYIKMSESCYNLVNFDDHRLRRKVSAPIHVRQRPDINQNRPIKPGKIVHVCGNIRLKDHICHSGGCISTTESRSLTKKTHSSQEDCNH